MVPRITTRQIWHAAILQAAGLSVVVEKQPCSARCVMSTEDTPEARLLIDNFDKGKRLDIPAKKITNVYINIVGACRALQVERVNGVAE
ncbi:hypothetical protein [Geomonas ferrireducens]|uniref:hypothetical protein n=1 Tax=Geomonas ferrireducens TaxID=2570227 RepID=UPI0010A7724A|nr:hypothetical protein [Geomonas ferrireducens]